MDENDSRWLAFGLNIPGAGQVPEPVAEVTVRPDGSGAVRVTWPRARRAEYYRLFAQVVGVDAEMLFRLRVKDREARLEGLPGGQTVRVQLVAANGTGEATASEVQECVVE
ncbi:MAG: fibronectin type III domain-containing protein [Verrucomicrobia bacterium]|nr:fibronectin type III domain-containing protein [Verrucomicrobiota bacterium]